MQAYKPILYGLHEHFLKLSVVGHKAINNIYIKSEFNSDCFLV